MKRLLRSASYVMLAGAGVLALTGILAEQDAPKPPPAQPTEATQEADRQSGARHICKRLITGVLNDPESVEWVDEETWAVAKVGSRYDVVAVLRARNAFNAMILTSFDCLVEVTDDSFVVVDLQER